MIRKTGSPVGETIVASLLRTRIDAGGGNDTLIGVSEDQLFGGDGNDVITAGAGDSFLSGDSGDDRLTDGAGNDALYGGDGNDILVSRAGSDWLQGDAGNDSFTIIRSASGQAGDGILGSGGSGNDDFYIDTSGSYYSYVAVYCGDGDDVVEIGGVSGWLDLTLGAGSDTIRFDSVPHGELFASVTVSDFQVGDGGDRLDFNRLLGFLVGNVTASPFTLGYLQLVQNGADTLVTSKFGDLATLKNVDAASLTAWNLGGYGQDGSLQGPTTVGGTPGDDLLFGGSGADTIDGGPGNDTIWGGMGNDTLTGGDGNDQLSADFGDNHLDGGAGDDILADGTGSDVLIGGDGNDTIIAEGSDTIDGGDGDDRLTSLVGDGDTAHAVTGAGADRITLFSEGGVATLDTGSDNDTVSIAELDGSLQLTLGSGSDLVTFNTSLTSGSVVITDFQTGDAGDVLDVVPLLTIGTNWNRTSNPFAAGNVRLLQAGADTLLQIDGAAGDGHWVTLATLQNTVATSFTAANLRGLPTDGSSAPGIVISGSGGITGTIGPDSITGSEGADNIKGAAGDDMIFGNGGNDRIDGGPGVDTVHGGGGDDTITVGSGADTVHGDDGADHLTGNVVGAHLFGDDGNDRIDDNAGAAEVDGGAGDDVIQIWVPGSPTVTVRGGSGDDAMLSVGGGTPNLIVDMGDGRDSVALFSFSAATITLGAGADALSLIYSLIGATAPSLVVTDFAAGAAGDWLDLSGLLSFNAGGWNQGMNPFDSFYLRVVQSGPDTLVQFDRDAAGSSADYVTVAVLQNVVATALTKENFGYGSDSADFFDLRAGAPGVWHGLGGDDVFYLGDAGAQFPGGRYDTVFADGGAGADTVVLQGDYSTGLLLANGALGDIETLRVLSHLDATYGGAGADPFSYVLQTDDDEVAEGAHLLVDASGLQADEPLTFDGSSETDGFLHVVGGAGADDITGGGAADLLEGGDGNDTLDGSYGDDVMAGGAGDDTYFVDDAGDLAVEQSGEGTDTVFTSLAAYTLPDNIENLTAELYADETLTGNALDNIITGFLGNDTIDGGTGADTMAGGVGDDVYFVDNAGDVVTEIAGEGTDEIRTTLATYTLPANVEKLTYAGSGNFTGIGSTGDDIITSNGGNDFFDLTQGGADKASGGGGTDAFSFGAAFGAGDSVDGGAGADTVGIRGDYSGANKLTIAAGQLVNVETLSIMTSLGGAVGYDITWEDGNLATNQKMAIYAGNLQAGENVTFDGSAETHGYFVMYGGLGTDNLKGGSSSDGFYFGPGKFTQADHVDGGGGGQNQLGLDGHYDFSAGSALGTFGGNFANIQTIVLYAGDTSYNIVTNDAAVAAGKLLTIFGTPVSSNLVFDGAAETDGTFRILSGTGDDTLTGGHGNDTLYGNLGADTLTGGTGNDVFLYTDAAQSTAAKTDHILDFDLGDKIDLSQIDADTTQAGDQAFAWIGAGAFGHHAGELRADLANGVWTIQGDTDGDGAADFTLLVTTANNHALVNTDLVL